MDDATLRKIEEIVELELTKYSSYSCVHKHETINVSPRGASVDIAKAIPKLLYCGFLINKEKEK